MKTRVAVSVAIASVLAFASAAAERVDFSHRPLLAGRASLTETGYVESRSLGVARLSPELTMPIELVYESYSEKTGAFGFAWRSPQLESSAAWDRDGVLWTSPWGERVKFFPKSEKPPKDAVKIEVVEEAKRGRGYFAPYSEWEADVLSGKPETSGNWVVRGRKSLVGWEFAYSSGRLAKITAPSGRSADFSYDADGRLLSVSHGGTAFVSVSYDGALAKSVTIAGITTTLAYESRKLEILPRTKDGKVAHPVRPQLVLMKRGSLDSVGFGYSGNYLASITQGAMSEEIAFEKSGRSARIVSDRDFAYAYGEVVTLRDKMNRTASYRYDAKNGVFRQRPRLRVRRPRPPREGDAPRARRAHGRARRLVCLRQGTRARRGLAPERRRHTRRHDAPFPRQDGQRHVRGRRTRQGGGLVQQVRLPSFRERPHRKRNQDLLQYLQRARQRDGRERNRDEVHV